MNEAQQKEGLTREQIEDWRRVLKSFLQLNGVVTTEQTRIEINALCDMALAALQEPKEGVTVTRSLAERTEAMFRSVGPDGWLALEWKDVLAAHQGRDKE